MSASLALIRPSHLIHYVGTSPLASRQFSNATRLFTLGCRRLGQILHFARFVVRLSSMSAVFALVFHVELRYRDMFHPVPFLAFGAVHGCIPRRRGIDPMKMVEA